MKTKILRLSRRRRLAYTQFGDLHGRPILFFHGWPSSRNAAMKFDALCSKLRIRLISPDRPGFGQSDFLKDRTLLDWPKDVVAIADSLRLKKFAVLGVSGGGPYAAVCGYKIPERITKLGIVVGLGPLGSTYPLDGISWISKVAWDNLNNGFIRKMTVFIQYFFIYRGLTLGLDRFFFRAKADADLYKNKEIKKSVIENYLEAFRQGYIGPEHDLKIYAENWGFDVKAIKTKTHLWYGADDKNVSINTAKYYHHNIKGSKLTVYAGEGHLISISHAKEILKTLSRT